MKSTIPGFGIRPAVLLYKDAAVSSKHQTEARLGKLLICLPLNGILKWTALWFVNVNDGFLSSYQHLYRTINGGKSWSFVNEVTGSYIHGIEFISDKNGFVYDGYGPLFYITRDGGDTWTTNFNNNDLALLPESHRTLPGNSFRRTLRMAPTMPGGHLIDQMMVD